MAEKSTKAKEQKSMSKSFLHVFLELTPKFGSSFPESSAKTTHNELHDSQCP